MARTIIFITLFLISLSTFAQNKKERQVEAAVTRLLKAMKDSDVKELSNITAGQLTYGHSAGNVENKQQFLNTFATGVSDYVTINISDQTINVIKQTAIVRHTIEADTNDNNIPGHLKLKVLTVWQKTGGQWKLIARQAVKPPAS